MTSQERADNAELIEEAKALGIKSPHMYKLEKLEIEVIEKRAVEEADEVEDAMEEVETVVEEVAKERSVAPDMVVANIREDNRAKVVAEQERLNPGVKFIYQASDITDAELAAKGLERTGIRVKNDILTRTTQTSFERYQKAKNDAQRDAMNSIDSIGTKIKSHDARAKTPVDAD